MFNAHSMRWISPELVWISVLLAACVTLAAVGLGTASQLSSVAGPRDTPSTTGGSRQESVAWRLNNPAPHIVPESKAHPTAVADKLASRVRSMEHRASLRAYEGAPPVIPHAIADLNIQTCRACHAEGLNAGDKVAKMVSHTYLTNCTQCHVEAQPTSNDPADLSIGNLFVGLRPSGYGGTRAWGGAPPVMPHTTFMRTNCISCHGEHGYDGWRPDHLSRTNCVQCHVPAAQFEQLAPTFGFPDIADGQQADARP
ncbi:MAG: nitrate reductase cytochrome c-type subunit [Phycisphaeraceae bacterium]|nr:MAG: nitrate reductase cytochrome c-type subunit [Phycisphaeraceae bacterium]